MKYQIITISAVRAKVDVETDDPVTDSAGDWFGFLKEKKKAKKEKTKHDSDGE